jgi:hypothetical protein
MRIGRVLLIDPIAADAALAAYGHPRAKKQEPAAA